MHVELSVALNFIISYLYNKLPRRRVNMFYEELEKGLRKKFEGHWYPEEPFKGSGFRSIKLSGEKVDPVLDLSAQTSGLSISEIIEYLPKGLTLWIDPNEVSYRIGENGSVKILYCNRRPMEDFALMEHGDHAMTTSSIMQGFNPKAESFQPLDQQPSLPSSSGSSMVGGGGGGGSTGSSSPSSGMSNSTSPIGSSFRPRLMPTSTGFTAATFAQTKFGSTKMKNQAQRPSRLSPTELGIGTFAGICTKRSPISPLSPSASSLWPGLNPCIPSPTSNVNLIPLSSPLQSFPQFIGLRDTRMEFLKEQQQLQMLLHQQQQQQQQQQHSHKMRWQNSCLPSGTTSLTSPSHADEGLMQDPMTSSLHSLYEQQQQQQHTQFFRSVKSANNKIAMSPVETSMTSSNDCQLLGQQHQQQHQPLDMNSIEGVVLPRNFLSENNRMNQMTGHDDVDWSALINPYANVSHLLVAN